SGSWSRGRGGAASISARVMPCVFTMHSPLSWRLGREGKPEGRKGEADERMEAVQRPAGRGEIWSELRLRPSDGDLLQHQSFDIVGDCSWHLQLDLCRLLRAVLRLIFSQRVAPRDRIAMMPIARDFRGVLK